MRFNCTLLISKLTIKLSKLFFNGGTNFPGKIALKLYPDILKPLSFNYKVIIITGTNGKTTTTSMVYNMLLNNGEDVITNETGANMLPGIISCFIDKYCIFKKNKSKYAVIEVDEANLKLVTQYITPYIICVSNLFRDQMDRYGEVYTTLEKIMDGIKKTPESILILNGDESLLCDLNLTNTKIYYGFSCAVDNNTNLSLNADAKFCKKCKSLYSYDFITYNHLGNFSCPNCGFKRPNLDYSITKINSLSSSGSVVQMDNYKFNISQSGTYNIYNALSAYTISSFIGVSKEVIAYTLQSMKSSFGRQEVVNIEGKHLKIILVKNPAGFDEALKSVNLDDSDKSLALLLNDNYADGTDVSWIWDVDFENLNNTVIDKVFLSGIRLYDMSIRLKVAGLNENSFNVCDNYENLLSSISSNNNDNIYMLATYTAMTSFRKFLNNKGYLKKIW
ncbi:MurT ligase domain-containing protein [Clostridium grantii]|uniref:Lipid II isoglutaminyl synthase (glutamine-hydrolyzing) subunit MurT n=1 Tax=Clostridium grantii DSM 8605 TaxID=1121316 RepID=A0A1M5RK16_9CLOT|nr:MurT ligase domain-containing protein [Clostridium grantii]SHH26479.1 UDP-N-acetylmuramyl tripeptide synthase [Clostridium grantii DSM 8605]